MPAPNKPRARSNAKSQPEKDRAQKSVARKQWDELLDKLEANREGSVPKDEALEEQLTKQMEGVIARLSPYELTRIRRPARPRLRNTLVDQDGKLHWRFNPLVDPEDLFPIEPDGWWQWLRFHFGLPYRARPVVDIFYDPLQPDECVCIPGKHDHDSEALHK